MPGELSAYAVAVWFVVGIATGAGWHLGGWLMSKLVTPRSKSGPA